ncbi:hypothetical protein DV736_g5284, partial [Chaetothyriales sp. CBS 134916]
MPIFQVFSPSRFEGSRATVVALRGPRDQPPLLAARRSRLAAELNTNTVAFIYDAPAINQPRILDVFILAATHFIFTNVERRTAFNIVGPSEHSNQQQTTVFRIPESGLNVPVFFNPYRQVAACAVPDIANLLKLDGPKIPWTKILETQGQSKNLPEIEKLGQGEGKAREYPVVSLGGRSWVLVDVSDHADVLKSVERQGIEVDGEVQGLIWFAQQKSQVGKRGEPTIDGLVIRVVYNGWEEEASANAAVMLAAWLSLEPKEDLAGKVEKLSVSDSKDENEKSGELSERRVFGVQTGAETGRPGTIALEIDLKVDKQNKKKIESIVVSGRANFTSRGQLIGT